MFCLWEHITEVPCILQQTGILHHRYTGWLPARVTQCHNKVNLMSLTKYLRARALIQANSSSRANFSSRQHGTLARYFFVRVIWVLFLLPRWMEQMIKWFSMKLNKYWGSFCSYFLVASTPTLKFKNVLIAMCRCRARARRIPTCNYCLYYYSLPSLPSLSALLSSNLKVSNSLFLALCATRQFLSDRSAVITTNSYT